MKSCVFIALIVVFITVLIEKSHCLPRPTVAGAVVTDNKETQSSPRKVEMDDKKDVKDKHPPEEEKISKTDLSANLYTEKVTLLPGEDISSVAATTTVSSAAKKTIPQEPVQQPEVNHGSAQDIPNDPHPTVGQETVPPPKAPSPEAKPADKKPQIEPSDEKDDAGGDEEQPDLDSINGVLQTDDKKELPAATIPNEKQPVKTPSEQVDSHDKKVDDVLVLPKPMFPEQENNHFFVYFMTIVAICVLGYFLFHNKQKIIALIVEGRHDRRRRAHSYRKLENEGTKGSPAIF